VTGQADVAAFGGKYTLNAEDPFTSPCLRASDWVGSPG
jgi:hypothetical protein